MRRFKRVIFLQTECNREASTKGVRQGVGKGEGMRAGIGFRGRFFFGASLRT